MSDRRLQITDDLHRYLVDHSVREPDVLARLRTATASLPLAQMQIGPEQGQLMALLAKLIDARRCIEIGVFTGYSSLAVALALPPDGRILACDVSEEWTAIARRFWREAGVEHKIELKAHRPEPAAGGGWIDAGQEEVGVGLKPDPQCGSGFSLTFSRTDAAGRSSPAARGRSR